MIVTDGLAKHYGKTLAVDDLGFTDTPGVVTGFLGLDVPDGVRALVNGLRYHELLDVVGLTAVAGRRASSPCWPCSGWGSARSSATVRVPSLSSWDARFCSLSSFTTSAGTRAGSCP